MAVMMGAFTLPDGSKVRTTTRRRYALLSNIPADSIGVERWGWKPGWSATGFTDKLASARTRVSRHQLILDTETGEVVR